LSILHILLSRTAHISLELHFCVELHTKKALRDHILIISAENGGCVFIYFFYLSEVTEKAFQTAFYSGFI